MTELNNLYELARLHRKWQLATKAYNAALYGVNNYNLMFNTKASQKYRSMIEDMSEKINELTNERT